MQASEPLAEKVPGGHGAQLAARHAKVETTIANYTDSALFDVQAAVDRLPLTPEPSKDGASAS